jgi:hypothetical protein
VKADAGVAARRAAHCEYGETPMLKIDPVKLRKALEELEHAAHDRTEWHDDLLRVSLRAAV